MSFRAEQAPMSSKPGDFRAFLDGATARVRRIRTLRGAAFGLAVAAFALLARWLIADGEVRSLTEEVVWGAVISITGLLAGAGIAYARSRSLRGRIALLVERTALLVNSVNLRNLLVTADELDVRASSRVSPRSDERAHAAVVSSPSTLPEDHHTSAIRQIVSRRASVLVNALDVRTLFPAKRALGEFAGAVALLALVLVAVNTVSSRTIARTVNSKLTTRNVAVDAIERVDIVVTPPRYTGKPPTSSSNSSRVELVSGSVVSLKVRANSSAVRISSADSSLVVTRRSSGLFESKVGVTNDGFIVVEAIDSTSAVVGRRLIGLSAVADAGPAVRILAPAHDIVLRDGLQTIPLTIEADDDIALSSLRLRYTKVSGSGERFTFAEGEVPLSVSRRSAREWNARANWNLGSLALGPGDMVVYRAVASDRRPGGTPSESETFIAQLMANDGEAAAGFSVDPDDERQVLSQQMLILKTERLIATRGSMSEAEFSERSQNLASEQRRVRAEFVFMMGGEMSEAVTADNSMGDLDESHEAEAEGDLSAGRMANQGRIALLAAIRAMSRASTALGTGDVAGALPEERNAVTQLERAFSRSRYLLRALTQREQLDMTRRGTGELIDVTNDRRSVVKVDNDKRVEALRGVLSDLAKFGAATRRSAMEASNANGAAPSLPMIAEKVLRIDPSSRAIQSIADSLVTAGQLLSGQSRAGIRESSARNNASIKRTASLVDFASLRISELMQRAQIATGGLLMSAEARMLSGDAFDEREQALSMSRQNPSRTSRR